MALQLLLMRHGEAAGSPDRERVLTETGIIQCREVAAALLAGHIQPDFILCSGVRRTRETRDVLTAALGFQDIQTVFCDDDLYRANHTVDILRIIGENVPFTARVPLVIGHNPTIHMTVCDLAQSCQSEHIHKIAAHYPPATTSIFSVTWENWAKPCLTGNALEQVILVGP